MKRHKTKLPSLFHVNAAVTFYHIDFGKSKRDYGGDWHDFPELLYVERGEHALLVDGERFVLCAGQAILFAPNAYHVGAGKPSSAVVSIVSFETDFAYLQAICNRVITLNDAQKRQLSAIVSEGVERFYNVPRESGEHGMTAGEDVSPLELMRLKNRLELLLIELYAGLSAQNAAAQTASNQGNLCVEELQKMTSFLRENLHRSLTQEEIAAYCKVSVSKLKRLCHEQLGYAPITYFLAMKIGEAKKLIRESTLNFTQIAERLGFGSIHYFSKFFKEKTGLTPSQYARSVYTK